MDDLIKFLEQMRQLRGTMACPPGIRYKGGEDLVLQTGVRSTGGLPLTAEQTKFVKATVRDARVDCAPRTCFHTAQMVALADFTGRLVYHEGWARGPVGFPIHHGWLILDGVHLIDLVWRHEGSQVLGLLPAGWAYAGVPMATDEVRRRVLETGETNSVLDDWRHGMALFA